MTQSRKKPVKLELSADLFKEPSAGSDAVKIKGQENLPSPSLQDSAQARPLSGQVKIRREVKGRAGKPVSVLFEFSDPNCSHAASLKALQAQLKEKLACGGSYDEKDCIIVLQVDDLNRVRAVLQKLGFQVKG